MKLRQCKELMESFIVPGVYPLIAAVLCLLFLFLPTSGDIESSLPSYLHTSVAQKLVASYILGKKTLHIS